MITILFLGAPMPILINTYAGVLNADAELTEMARSAGASRAQIFRRIMLPGAGCRRSLSSGSGSAP